MLERIGVLVVAFAIILGVDVRALRRNTRRERLVYVVFMGIAFYLGADYLLEYKLPHMDELVDWIFTVPAKLVTSYLETHA